MVVFSYYFGVELLDKPFTVTVKTGGTKLFGGELCSDSGCIKHIPSGNDAITWLAYIG